MHRRFFNSDDEKSLVRRVENVLGDNKPLPYSDEVAERLRAAMVPIVPVTNNEIVCLPGTFRMFLFIIQIHTLIRRFPATTVDASEEDGAAAAVMNKRGKKRTPSTRGGQGSERKSKRSKRGESVPVMAAEVSVTVAPEVATIGPMGAWKKGMFRSVIRNFGSTQVCRGQCII